MYTNIRLIQEKLSSEFNCCICTLLHAKTGKHCGASMANTRMSLSRSRHPQCYF